MSSEESLNWLSKQKEKRALELCRKHMEEIVKVTESMKNSIYSFSDEKKDFDDISKEVFDHERAGDKQKKEILEELSEGNFPPLSREMIIRLIMTIDDIADNARAGTMKLAFLDPKDINEELREDLKQLGDFAHESAIELDRAFKNMLEDPKNAIEKTGEVERIEEKADRFRGENLIPKLIEWADESQKPGTSYIFVEVEGNIEEVLDQAENSADVIREISIRSM